MIDDELNDEQLKDRLRGMTRLVLEECRSRLARKFAELTTAPLCRTMSQATAKKLNREYTQQMRLLENELKQRRPRGTS